MDYGLFQDLCQCEGLTIHEPTVVPVGCLRFFDAAEAMQTRCPVCRFYNQRSKYVTEDVVFEGEHVQMEVLSFWHCTHCNNVLVCCAGESGVLEDYFPDIAHWEVGRDIKEGVTVSISMERGIGRLASDGVVWQSWKEVDRDIAQFNRELLAMDEANGR